MIEKDPAGGYVGSIAELPGCHTQGETLRELRANIKEAIELYLEDEDSIGPLPTFVRVERSRCELVGPLLRRILRESGVDPEDFLREK